MIEARVGDVATRLILDTGSSDHVLTIELAGAAGLDAEPGEPGTDHAGAEVPSWTLGRVAASVDTMDFTLGDTVAIAAPPRFVERGMGGLLSPQHLHPTALAVIDLTDNRFLLVEAGPDAVAGWAAARWPALVSIALSRVSGEPTPVVEASIEPFPPVPALLNTGGRATEFAAPAVPGLRGVDPDRLGHGVGGSAVLGSEAMDRTLRVGAVRAAVPKLLIRAEITEILGLIGIDVLRGTVVVVGADPATGVVWLVPRTALADRVTPSRC